MNWAEPRRTGRLTAARLAALWIALDEQLRDEALASGLRARNRTIRDALKELVAVRAFVRTPERILGSDLTKHGEMAEHVHVAIHRAKDLLHQRRPTTFLDGLPQFGPVDYVDGGASIQSKYYRGLSESLGGVLTHVGKYEDFATGSGRYHIPKDHFEQFQDLRGTGSVKGLSARIVRRIERHVAELRQETGRPIEEVLAPGVASYNEVQFDRVHKTIDDWEKKLAREREDLRAGLRDEFRKSRSGAGKAAAVGALAGSSLGLASTLWSKYLEGKNTFRGEFTGEDWQEAGVSALKGAGTGAVSGFSVYVLTDTTMLGAPFAGSLVSALMGVGTLLGQRAAGEIDDTQFVDLTLMVGADSALACIAGVVGQTLIPVPLLGAFVGSVAGKLAEHALRGGLGVDAESELLVRLQVYETEAIDALDESLRAAVSELDALFGRLENLMAVAFHESVNTHLRLAASIWIAESTSVPSERTLRSVKEIDTFRSEWRWTPIPLISSTGLVLHSTLSLSLTSPTPRGSMLRMFRPAWLQRAVAMKPLAEVGIPGGSKRLCLVSLDRDAGRNMLERNQMVGIGLPYAPNVSPGGRTVMPASWTRFRSIPSRALPTQVRFPAPYRAIPGVVRPTGAYDLPRPTVVPRVVG